MADFHSQAQSTLTGDEIGNSARQVLPLGVVTARQTKHTRGGTLRRQNNLSSEAIFSRLSAAVLIAIKCTLLYTEYDKRIGSLWKKINILLNEISD